MTENKTTWIKGPLARNLFWHAALPLAFVLIMFFFYPFRDQFELDLDEGINLMKGLLLERGYSLYGEIWSDQPPLFTYMLAGLFKIVGYEVNPSRMLVLLLSGVLFWAVIQYLRMVWGGSHALVAAGLLLLLPTYKSFSVSVDIGLPTITFATLSLLSLTAWHQKRNMIWLILSALALSLSIQIKLFTGFLIPVFVIGIIGDEYIRGKGKGNWRLNIRAALYWLAVFGGVTIALGLALVGPNNLPQLIEPHIALSGANLGVMFDETSTLSYYIRHSITVILLAFAGGVFAVRSQRWLALYPLAWMITAYAVFSLYNPVRVHYQLLVTIPAAIMAAAAIGETIREISRALDKQSVQPVNFLLISAVTVITALLLASWIPRAISQFNARPILRTTSIRETSAEARFLTEMHNFGQETRWMVTDLPMYAFRIGVPVPPHLAVFSFKRVITGNLTEDEVIHSVEEWQPEQVLIGRFIFPDLEEYLKKDYALIHERSGVKLYVRKDL